jgi:hypothetical protein
VGVVVLVLLVLFPQAEALAAMVVLVCRHQLRG